MGVTCPKESPWQQSTCKMKTLRINIGALSIILAADWLQHLKFRVGVNESACILPWFIINFVLVS